MSHKQINRTRIHLILFSPLPVGDGQGWQDPISCDDIPAMEDIVAREGSVEAISKPVKNTGLEILRFHTEQRVVPTGLAARDNEVKQRRDLSESIFREWLPADAVRDGAIHDWAMTKAQRGGASPVYVTRFGEP